MHYHRGCTDLVTVICSSNWIHTTSWDHTLHIVICKSKVVQKRKKYICRISISFAGICLIKLINNKYQIRGTSQRYSNTSGIRDQEQAAEHIAANALYQIEVNHVEKVEYTREMVEELLK